MSKMTENLWEKIRYFTPQENWGDWRKLDSRLILWLDQFREEVGKPFIVHCAYATSGHSKGSYHYKGKAVDGRFQGVPLLLQFLHALKFGWKGIGVYPYWKTPGIHLDLREMFTCWWRKKDGSYSRIVPEYYEEIFRDKLSLKTKIGLERVLGNRNLDEIESLIELEKSVF